MSSNQDLAEASLDDLLSEEWRLDPARSSVEFRVPHFWGLVTVKGHFDRYQGTLNLQAEPALELTVEADSLDTSNRRRDQHLRSADFFDAERHPQVRFVSDSAARDADTMRVHGALHARGSHIPLQLDARIRVVDGELQLEAEAQAPHRQLGMTWSPLSMVRPYSKLIVEGVLTRTRPNGRD